MSNWKQKKSGIYEIVLVETEERYIGRAQDIDTRWYQHRYLLSINNHDTPKLQAVWNEYGEAAFEFNIVELCAIENLIQREQFHLDFYRDCPDRLFNAHLSASGCVSHTAETRALMSDIASTPERVAATSARFKDVPKTEEHAAAISKAKMGHAVSEETRAAISKTLSGRPGNPKAIIAMAAANTGSTRTPEVVARASAWQDDPVKFAAAMAKTQAKRVGWKPTEEQTKKATAWMNDPEKVAAAVAKAKATKAAKKAAK